ncbi:MAG: glycosyltransferase [Spirulinaceae cyanobacterium RM2_2_10]|nr:glycosyltransferase [Spirulinaceae cyanobacterium SM2_1_0]NJO19716.1 glycosyltransferase [Spirulinaceae cyanobacterium RM2_2_10]
MTTTRPVISIIIPVYNGERTISATINSVLAQTFTDFEIIVINDGSRDRTVEAVASITDPRIQLYSYPNARQATSRNRGIRHAQGDFFAFLDADDLWTADKLADQLAALQAYPEAGLAYSWTDYIDEGDRFVQAGRHQTINGDARAALLANNFIENGSNPLVRRSAIEATGEFEASLPPAEDWDYWLRLADHYPFAAVPKPQILYRLSSTSSSANLALQANQCQRVLNRAFERLPAEFQALRGRSTANLYKYLAWKALGSPPSRASSWAAIHYIIQYARYEPETIRELKFILVMLLKSGRQLLWPAQPAG